MRRTCIWILYLQHPYMTYSIAVRMQDTDSAGQKFGGALLNAIIFMAVIAGMTFVLFLLFKWGVSGQDSPISCSAAHRNAINMLVVMATGVSRSSAP